MNSLETCPLFQKTVRQWGRTLFTQSGRGFLCNIDKVLNLVCKKRKRELKFYVLLPVQYPFHSFWESSLSHLGLGRADRPPPHLTIMPLATEAEESHFGPLLQLSGKNYFLSIPGLALGSGERWEPRLLSHRKYITANKHSGEKISN